MVIIEAPLWAIIGMGAFVGCWILGYALIFWLIIEEGKQEKLDDMEAQYGYGGV